MRKIGFTLVELLVVVFIILVLAGILFPVIFGHSHPHAPRSSCQSNLKQICLGFKQYTQDWDELFPQASLHIAARTQANPAWRYGWVDALQPYLKSTQIFQCTSEQKQGTETRQPWETGYTDYYYNGRVAGKEETKFNNSANTVLMGEGNDGVDVNDARYMHSSIPIGWEKDTTSPIYRHLEGSNFAFVDGHVKWLKFDRHPTTERATGSNFTFSS